MSASPIATSAADLAALLPDLTIRDERRLRRRLDGARKIRDRAARQTTLDKIATDVETALDRIRRRRESAPSPRYPESLPVSRRRDELLEAIRDHQVVV